MKLIKRAFCGLHRVLLSMGFLVALMLFTGVMACWLYCNDETTRAVNYGVLTLINVVSVAMCVDRKRMEREKDNA